MNALIGKNDIQHLATTAINAVVEGEIDPVEAFIEVSKMEAAIELFKKNELVRDMVVTNLERNGGKQSASGNPPPSTTDATNPSSATSRDTHI